MKKIVLLGGNGYIGKNILKYWLEKDNSSIFYVVSRSGKISIENERIINIAEDVNNFKNLSKKLPEKIDYIIDLVGRPEKDEKLFLEINDKPAEAMLKLAIEKNAKVMGFIGGKLGPKSFIEGKKRIGEKLKNSKIETVIVEPTIVYGNGRKDTVTKLVPLLKIMSIFNKKLKPTNINELVYELVEGILERD